MLEFLVDNLISLLGPIATLSKDRRDIKDSALRAISTALTETKLYYRDRQSGKPRNMDTEAQLAKYWAAAAIPLRHIDEHLAMICEHKADFWTGPDNWTSEKVKKFGIKLEDVTKAYHSIAMPRFSVGKQRDSHT